MRHPTFTVQFAAFYMVQHRVEFRRGRRLGTDEVSAYALPRATGRARSLTHSLHEPG